MLLQLPVPDGPGAGGAVPGRVGGDRGIFRPWLVRTLQIGSTPYTWRCSSMNAGMQSFAPDNELNVLHGQAGALGYDMTDGVQVLVCQGLSAQIEHNGLL